MTTPETAVLAAHQAFYMAFARADAEAMESLWARSVEVVCAHPGRRALRTRDVIVESWEALFRGGVSIHIMPYEPHVTVMGKVACVTCYEYIEDESDDSDRAVMLATNVFVLEDDGVWRIMHHHAGPVAHPVPRTPAPPAPPGTALN